MLFIVHRSGLLTFLCCIIIYYVKPLLFTHSSVHEHLHYFLFWTIMNSVAVKVTVYIFWSAFVYTSIKYIFRNEIAGIKEYANGSQN